MSPSMPAEMGRMLVALGDVRQKSSEAFEHTSAP
jgi:hypothetical protein